jgi:hypothetical protein
VALQAGGLVLTGALGVLTAVRFDLLTVAVLCLATALVAGLSKLAVDAAIQERIDEQVRASAFAHSETVLMLAWVVGGGFGLIPFHGRLGVAAAAGFTVLAAVRAVIVAGRLRRDRLRGRASTSPAAAPSPTEPASPPVTATLRPDPPARRAAEPPAGPATGSPPVAQPQPTRAKPAGSSWRRRRRGTPAGHTSATNPPVGASPASGGTTSGGGSASTAAPSRSAIPAPSTDTDDSAAPPGFHIYRPSSPETGDGPTWPDSGGHG